MNSLFSNIFHIVFNTFVIFFLFSIFLEFIIFVCRIKNSRLKVFLRLLPLIKIPVDVIFLKLFYIGSFFNLNPFSCEYYLIKSIKKLIPYEIGDSTLLGHLFVASIFFISFIFVTRKIIQLILSQIYLKKVLQTSALCTRPFQNQMISTIANKVKAKIMVSTQTVIPFATLSSCIVLPQALVDTLPQDEFEAIVAHELGHLRWKDPFMKLMSQLIAATFWWIPSKWWLKKIELDQEEACDQAIYAYGIDTLSLASGIVKILSYAKGQKEQQPLTCQIATAQNVHVKRLKNILDFKRTLQFNPLYVNSLIATSSCIFIFCTWWIC